MPRRDARILAGLLLFIVGELNGIHGGFGGGVAGDGGAGLEGGDQLRHGRCVLGFLLFGLSAKVEAHDHGEDRQKLRRADRAHERQHTEHDGQRQSHNGLNVICKPPVSGNGLSRINHRQGRWYEKSNCPEIPNSCFHQQY